MVVVSYAVGFSENVIMLHSEMEFVCLFSLFDIVDKANMGVQGLWPDGHRIVLRVGSSIYLLFRNKT